MNTSNTPPFDLAKAQRWFAVEGNNSAWNLLEKAARTPAETEQLVHAAHAAAWHWAAAGTAVNRVRALQLLAVTYAELERPAEAMRYADVALDTARAHSSELADFDLPFVFEACARARAAAGQDDVARQFLAQAEHAARQIVDLEDRKLAFDLLAARNWFGLRDLITLVDAASGATARIHAGFGFNCYDLQLSTGNGLQPVLWAAEGFETGQQRASGSGTPLLFPFPGRIAQGRFEWGGETYEIPPTDNRGNAIHGFVLNRPWRVVERSATRVVGEFQGSVDAPDLAQRWPADYGIRATYELSAQRFVMRYELWNPDRRPLPCGFGSHPYFRLPLGGNNRDGCLVSLPVHDEWELVELLPTGRRRPPPNATQLQAGVPFANLQLDNVFAGLQFDGDESAATIRDPDSGRQLRIAWDRAFRELVVYTPPHREAICIEPYTCVPGAVQLVARQPDTGLLVLQPGERTSATIVFELA